MKAFRHGNEVVVTDSVTMARGVVGRVKARGVDERFGDSGCVEAERVARLSLPSVCVTIPCSRRVEGFRGSG